MWRIFLRSEVWIFPTRAYGAGSWKALLVMARARSTMKARSWMFPRAIEAERQSSVEVDAQAAKETRLATHPDHNR